MNRRHFLNANLSLAGILGLRAWTCAKTQTRELQADVVILGGGLGGCAAALAAARQGASVLLTEETDWVGGQLTQQAVPPDEHPWIESFGCTRTYRQLRNGIRDYYRHHYPLTTDARQRVQLNPGNGGVSRLCHEPRVALAVLMEMLAPDLSGNQIQLLLFRKAARADVAGDKVLAVTVRHQHTGEEQTLRGSYFLDATEHGDLLPLTRTEYVTGFEAQNETGEPHAPLAAQPTNLQAFTCCFAMDYLPDEENVIPRPAAYDEWRRYDAAAETRVAGAIAQLGNDRTEEPQETASSF